MLLAAPTPTAIQITVRDTGCGIPPDKIETVFERLSRAHPGDRRCLGLGLYTARCIVETHGGRIWGESEFGKGSSFHFTLECPS